MKRSEIKRRPLADTTLASLESEAAAYRELDSAGLYFRVKPNGGKSWSCATRNRTANGHGWGWVVTRKSAAPSPDRRPLS